MFQKNNDFKKKFNYNSYPFFYNNNLKFDFFYKLKNESYNLQMSDFQNILNQKILNLKKETNLSLDDYFFLISNFYIVYKVYIFIFQSLNN